MGAARSFNQRYVDGDVAATLSAAGTTISDATEVTAAHSYVTTVAAGAGVKLVAKESGFNFSVANAGANALKVYPPSSSVSFNGATAGDPAIVPVNGALWAKAVNSTKMIAVVGAGE